MDTLHAFIFTWLGDSELVGHCLLTDVHHTKLPRSYGPGSNLGKHLQTGLALSMVKTLSYGPTRHHQDVQKVQTSRMVWVQMHIESGQAGEPALPHYHA